MADYSPQMQRGDRMTAAQHRQNDVGCYWLAIAELRKRWLAERREGESAEAWSDRTCSAGYFARIDHGEAA